MAQGIEANNPPTSLIHPAILKLVDAMRAEHPHSEQPESLGNMFRAIAIKAAGDATQEGDFPKNFGDCLGSESESEPEV